jgi:hypothetical protein
MQRNDGIISCPCSRRQLLLRCSTSCIHAVVLTLLTYIPVGNVEDGRKDKSVTSFIIFTFLSLAIIGKIAG